MYRPLFERVVELMGTGDEEICDAEIEEGFVIYDEQLAPGLRLVDLDTQREITLFSLNIMGSEASLTY